MPQSSKEPAKSDYPELTLPSGGFQSNIPSHLLENATKADKWLMEQISKNTQAIEWNNHATIDTNLQVRKTNGRLKDAEQQVIDLKSDVEILKTQMGNISPFTTGLATIRLVLSNKIVWFIIGTSILFLLGINRDVLPTIFKFFFSK